MGHMVNHWSFKVGTNKSVMADEIAQSIAEENDFGENMECCETWYETGMGCARDINWKDKVFDTYEQAESYLESIAGNYDQLAVKYRVGKVSKRTKAIEDKLAVAYNAWKEAENTNVFNIKSAFVGCKRCSSKLNTKIMKNKNTHNCIVCGNDLRSPTLLKTIERRDAKVQLLRTQLKASQAKDNEKGTEYWLIRTEYHC